MSKWTVLGIAAMWLGIGLVSFNIGPAIIPIAEYAIGGTIVIAIFCR